MCEADTVHVDKSGQLNTKARVAAGFMQSLCIPSLATIDTRQSGASKLLKHPSVDWVSQGSCAGSVQLRGQVTCRTALQVLAAIFESISVINLVSCCAENCVWSFSTLSFKIKAWRCLMRRRPGPFSERFTFRYLANWKRFEPQRTTIWKFEFRPSLIYQKCCLSKKWCDRPTHAAPWRAFNTAELKLIIYTIWLSNLFALSCSSLEQEVDFNRSHKLRLL